ncbi:MAG TPA: sporulation protein YqfC [Firmicutes bacterium]|nr:sporulation protein YqfC [Candidatus Fermentithermobacillaceae bacterium]
MLRKIKQDLAEILELPLDVSLDLPKIVIIGELGVLIQNHRGLIQYSPDRIVVGVGEGQITVAGESLKISEVNQEDMIVRGRIKTVQMST